jgi:hypothetical protein
MFLGTAVKNQNDIFYEIKCRLNSVNATIRFRVYFPISYLKKVRSSAHSLNKSGAFDPFCLITSKEINSNFTKVTVVAASSRTSKF